MRFRNCVRPLAVVLAAGGLVAACSVEEAKTDTSRSALFGGADTSTHPEAGFLTIERGVAGSLQPNAVLVAPKLVVTTSFGVTRGYTYGTGVSYDSAGAVCATIAAVVDPSEITFTLGDNATNPAGYLAGNRGTSRGVTQIITNGETDTCKGGLAFVVLDQPIDGVTFPTIELDRAPLQNDPLTACGWGQLDAKCTFPKKLQCVTGNTIIGGADGGYYAADQDNFPPGFILTSINTCGDRGGPLYDTSGALIGIVDRYVNPDKSKVPTLEAACGDCSGAVSDAYLLGSYRELIARAFAAVGASPHRAGHPAPADVGGSCTDSLDCNSQLCVSVGKSSYCSQDCASAACPASTTCTAVGAAKVCLPEVNPQPASCTAGVMRTGQTMPPFVWGGIGIGLGLVVARVARRSARNRSSR